MFSPAASAIRQKILGRILRTPLESSQGPVQPIDHEAKDLDPDTLSGADEVAFYDLKEHEDRYEVLLSARFDFSSLAFAQDIVPTNTPIDTDVESVINALLPNHHATQKFVYRLNSMNLLLDYVRATQCAHPTLVMQRNALITALTVDIDGLVQNAMQQWVVYTTEVTKKHGLQVVHPGQ
ncbi:hypothetical protein RSOLAG1IB_08625 [Rhizoctonia solani AG-1 IB]|uniref:Uncharacterized protein n=1 Tax=Thanatephorus cucumeris (strain AG1-IB / isolate 7/3/14) TaxID=1108050 RepID=M5CDP5_THACB|nr:hypothetical protein BN14_11677 [Rhizoctonia solani AG-1 IB]CEL58533.1 hypothetical protein RSOLAG1IB_08625 [Rhizoctonia solani AG-1 IB]